MLPMPESKIAVPAVPDLLVQRPRLLAALDRDDPSGERVTLVCAPRGYGRTTLLAHWARVTSATGPGVAWVTLDRGDDDPRRLWTGILAALTAHPAIPPGSPLHELARAPISATESAGPAFVADVLDALDGLPVRVPLVLHDVHELVAPAALRALEAIVAARPAGLRVVLSSRLDPPLSLGTLRSAGRLDELRADRLRFSPDEAGAVLHAEGVRLSPAQTWEVHARTAGWPTGVRLAGAVLRAGADPDAFLVRFVADPGPVADFLVGEVLASLPDGDRELLTAAGTDDPLAAGLVAALTGWSDARAALDRLARDTGLVTPVREHADRYRVDPLLAAYLHAERGHRPPAADRHGRAARWWAGENDAVGALQHAARAGDDALLTEFVHRFAGTLLVTGEHDALRDALSRLHERAAADDPWLALCSALTHIEAGDAAKTQADLHRVGSLWPAEPEPELVILRSVTELFAAASAADLTAVPSAPARGRHEPDAPEWAALALVGAGGAGLLVHSDRVAATAALQEALGLARRYHFSYLEMQCLALLGGVAGVAGDYRAMTTAAEGAVATAVGGGWDGSLWSTAGRWMLAYAALLRSEPAVARDIAAQALLHQGTARQARMTFALHVVHGAALFDLGSRHRGLQEMQQARTDLGTVSLTGEQAAALAVLEHRAALALGRPDAARAVVDWLTDRSGPLGEVLLMRAWADLAAGRDDAAHSAVGALLDGSVPALLPHTVIEALLVETTAGVTGGAVYRARHALGTALSLGAPLDVVRPFAMAEPPARALLGRQLGRGGTAEPFAARALAAGRTAHRRRTGPLSDDELAMIELLPSPLSVEQIAAELGIRNTEEAHGMIRTIYHKLGVSSRRTAVSTAFERNLLR
jgi:LuxR family transcriptional regulator, maltose regulon positive regulatory protein